MTELHVGHFSEHFLTEKSMGQEGLGLTLVYKCTLHAYISCRSTLYIFCWNAIVFV